MLCVVIKGPTIADIQQQLTKAVAITDLVELRLDGFTEISLTALKQLRTTFKIPMIFTLRSRQQGGNYANSEEMRLTELRRLAALLPEYLDIEDHVSAAFIAQIAAEFPSIKLILSHHDFTGTPPALDHLYQAMQQIPAHYYKIAVTAHNSVEALRLLCWAKNRHHLIPISMGPHGQISRILGPVVGSPITYASLENSMQTAPGQLSAKLLIERYQIRMSNHHTAIFGLIGDPVDPSISDETHNHVFSTYSHNAVYVKIEVKPAELAAFLPLAQQLPFKGLSVTMPLKEYIIPHLDEITSPAQAMGAVNTLVFGNGKITGSNTDGKGALNAIETHGAVKGKRLVIIGAGGAAKAIAFEAQHRGAFVIIVNRHIEKAQHIAARYNGRAYGLEHMEACAEAGYDIIINCTPLDQPIASKYILPKAIAMDIKTKPLLTPFLKEAQGKGCTIIHGYQMFVEQAVGQYHLWFNNPAHDLTQLLAQLAKNAVLRKMDGKRQLQK